MIYNQKEAGTIPSICSHRTLLAWFGLKIEYIYLYLLWRATQLFCQCTPKGLGCLHGAALLLQSHFPPTGPSTSSQRPTNYGDYPGHPVLDLSNTKKENWRWCGEVEKPGPFILGRNERCMCFPRSSKIRNTKYVKCCKRQWRVGGPRGIALF